MDEYRVDLKVRNNLILSKIEQMGYINPHVFCNDIGIPYSTLLNFINMKRSIFDTKGRLVPFIQKLCEKLNCIPEEIFSSTQMDASLKTNKKTLLVQEAEMKFMLEQSEPQKLLEEFVEEDQLKELTEKALDTLTPREKKTVQMRMGLIDGKECTYEEISQELGITRTRCRQIYEKAMRKLRHPSRSVDLRGYINADEVYTEKEKKLSERRKFLLEQRRNLLYHCQDRNARFYYNYDKIEKELSEIESIIGNED